MSEDTFNAVGRAIKSTNGRSLICAAVLLLVGPTLAELRGLELPGAQGRVFVGVLDLPAGRGPGGASGGDLQ